MNLISKRMVVLCLAIASSPTLIQDEEKATTPPEKIACEIFFTDATAVQSEALADKMRQAGFKVVKSNTKDTANSQRYWKTVRSFSTVASAKTPATVFLGKLRYGDFDPTIIGKRQVLMLSKDSCESCEKVDEIFERLKKSYPKLKDLITVKKASELDNDTDFKNLEEFLVKSGYSYPCLQFGQITLNGYDSSLEARVKQILKQGQ